ncbi:MAG TPA: class I SAM-dependent methyltransferase [Virgibacillus sp.]|nr:class I SAM-dependent methyltransferase [Virgibacillus sp.]
MSKWFPYFYDHVMKLEQSTNLYKARKALLAIAYGHVLEVGSGTGINFPLYNNAISIDALEPNPRMIDRAQNNIRHATTPINMHKTTAENMNFQEDTFDTVVNTLVFCTIPEPEKALANIRYVAKPNAPILFLEHVRMKQPILAKTQDILTPLSKRMADGCHLNRDTLATIKNSGLLIKHLHTFYKSLAIAVICENDKVNES